MQIGDKVWTDAAGVILTDSRLLSVEGWEVTRQAARTRDCARHLAELTRSESEKLLAVTKRGHMKSAFFLLLLLLLL